MCSLMGKVCVGTLSGLTAFVGLVLVWGVCELLHSSDVVYFVRVLALGFTVHGFQHNWPTLLSMMYILCYCSGLILHVSMVLSFFMYQYYE
jgi:hypothetical protein